MNSLFKRIAILSSIIQNTIFAQNSSMSVMLVDGVGVDDQDYLLARVEETRPTTLIAYNCNCFAGNIPFYLEDYPYIYPSAQSENLKIMSTYPIDHIVIHKINEFDFVLELATDRCSGISYVGHLPTLDSSHLETLKSYLIATNTYSKVIFWGDLNNSSYSPLWELCVKGDAGASAEADTKGNKSAKGDVTIKSDDEKYKAKGQIEYCENEKGEKVGKAKVEVRIGF